MEAGTNTTEGMKAGVTVPSMDKSDTAKTVKHDGKTNSSAVDPAVAASSSQDIGMDLLHLCSSKYWSVL